MMMANRDLELVYMNPASVKTLTPLQHLLPKPLDQLMGGSIDVIGNVLLVDIDGRPVKGLDVTLSYVPFVVEWADTQVSPIPNVLLPPSKIRDYVGPTLLQALEKLEVARFV